MREWFRKQSGVWNFGLFLLALLGTVGGLAFWGLDAQDAKQNAKVEKLTAIAAAATRAVDEKAGAEVKRLDSRVDSALELTKQINARLDRVDDRFDRMDDRLDRMDVKLDRMNGRLNQMEVRLDRMEVRLDQMDGRLDQMDGKLDILLTRIPVPAPD